MKTKDRQNIDIKIPVYPNWRHLSSGDKRLHFAFELIRRRRDYDNLVKLNPFIDIDGNVWSLGQWKVWIKDLTQPVSIRRYEGVDLKAFKGKAVFTDPKRHTPVPVKVGSDSSYPLILSIDKRKEPDIEKLLKKIGEIIERQELAALPLIQEGDAFPFPRLQHKKGSKGKGRPSTFEILEGDLLIFDLKDKYGYSLTYSKIKEVLDTQMGKSSPAYMVTSEALKEKKKRMLEIIQTSLREKQHLMGKKLFSCPVDDILKPYIK